MTAINQPAVYIEVPIPLLDETECEAVGGSPLRPTDSLSPHAPGGAGGLGGGASLVQYKSITDTHQKQPSAIAKAALEKLNSLPDGDNRKQYSQLCFDFCEYLEQCEQKGFMIKGYDTKKGKVLNLPMSYCNRWGPVRRRELSDKLERLEYWFDMQSDREVTMLTLTSYHPDNETVKDSWFKLNKSREKLLKMLRKYLGDIDYFWVPEPHPSSDNGYVHYHIAVFAEIPIALENKLRDLWSRKYQTGSHTYGLDFSKKKNKDDKIQHLKQYLSKYLRKGFLIDEWSIGLLIFNATLREGRFRMYGASSRIRAMMNIKDDKENDIVWLETRLCTCEPHQVKVEKIDRSVWPPKHEEVIMTEWIDIDKVIWYRQYIPDWLDSDFWQDSNGQLRITDPPKTYIYEWGRKARERGRQDVQPEPTKPQLMERQRRKLERDGYL